jgi:LCP family protein required for cell wall assembly
VTTDDQTEVVRRRQARASSPYAPPRHGRQKRAGAVVLPAIAGVLAMVIVLSGGYAAWSYSKLTGSITHIANVIPHASSSASDVDGQAQNILLVGDDHRPAGATDAQMAQLGTTDDGGSQNTDTMIVLHIAADGKSASMVSFPRDSWVQIPGVGMGKLNSAYYYGTLNGGGAAGGARLLIQTIQNISGLSIDHYVRVSLLGFYQIVQQMGPVTVCLNEAVYDRYSKIDLPAGTSTLNASQALSFVRQRHGLPRGDLDREVRQQYFLTQEAKKILSAGTLLNPIKMTSILGTIGSSIETDMTTSDMVKLGSQMRNLNVGNIRSATVPTLGTPTVYVNGVGVSTVALDSAGMPAFIQSIIGSPAAYTTAKAASPSSVSVTVLNGSGVTGAATTASTALTAKGFSVGTPGTASSETAATLVEYPAGQEAQAKAVVAVIPGATPVLTSTVSSVTVVLGTDGKTVASDTATSGSSSAAGSSGSGSSEAAGSGSSSSAASTPSATKAGNAYGVSGTCIN